MFYCIGKQWRHSHGRLLAGVFVCMPLHAQNQVSVSIWWSRRSSIYTQHERHIRDVGKVGCHRRNQGRGVVPAKPATPQPQKFRRPKFFQTRKLNTSRYVSDTLPWLPVRSLMMRSGAVCAPHSPLPPSTKQTFRDVDPKTRSAAHQRAGRCPLHLQSLLHTNMTFRRKNSVAIPIQACKCVARAKRTRLPWSCSQRPNYMTACDSKPPPADTRRR